MIVLAGYLSCSRVGQRRGAIIFFNLPLLFRARVYNTLSSRAAGASRVAGGGREGGSRERDTRVPAREKSAVALTL
jgi:hypothetical protein